MAQKQHVFVLHARLAFNKYLSLSNRFCSDPIITFSMLYGLYYFITYLMWTTSRRTKRQRAEIKEVSWNTCNQNAYHIFFTIAKGEWTNLGHKFELWYGKWIWCKCQCRAFSGYWMYICSKVVSKIPKNSKNSESGKKTGESISQTYDHCIPIKSKIIV